MKTNTASRNRKNPSRSAELCSEMQRKEREDRKRRGKSWGPKIYVCLRLLTAILLALFLLLLKRPFMKTLSPLLLQHCAPHLRRQDVSAPTSTRLASSRENKRRKITLCQSSQSDVEHKSAIPADRQLSQLRSQLKVRILTLKANIVSFYKRNSTLRAS